MLMFAPMAGREELERAKKAVVQRYGPWMSSNVDLGEGVFTISADLPRVQPNIVRFGQLIGDLTGRPLAGLRILDLACSEGEYAIAFARAGAQVVGIEGRRASVEKARFAQQVLGLHNLEFVEDDVRNATAAKYGSFDAVLCAGILYHLDAPDVASFLQSIGAMCRRCLIVDTHVSRRAARSFVHGGIEYWGGDFVEHHAAASESERAGSLWASLDNRVSFWFTRPSLYNALAAAGFTSVVECHVPAVIGRPPDRITLAAVKGEKPEPAPALWPEKPAQSVSLYYLRQAARNLAMRMPKPLARLIRPLAGKSR